MPPWSIANHGGAHVAETASRTDGKGICHDDDNDDDAATKATTMTIATVKTVASPSILASTDSRWGFNEKNALFPPSSLVANHGVTTACHDDDNKDMTTKTTATTTMQRR
jgi:hypothetical protein